MGLTMVIFMQTTKNQVSLGIGVVDRICGVGPDKSYS